MESRISDIERNKADGGDRAPQNSLWYYRTTRFTLIELIVVIGIMAMLMYIAMPAFTKLAKGSGVSLASKTLVGKLGLTRGYAVANKQYAALIFYQADVPAAGSTPEGDSAKPKYLNKAYRVCYLTKYTNGLPSPNDETRYYFKSWVQGEDWDYTPSGTIVLEVNDQPDVHLDGGNLLEPQNTVKKGGAANSAFFTKAFFNLAEATDDATSGANDKYVPAIIFSPSGKLLCSKGTNSNDNSSSKYVKIGEGTYSGNALTVTNKAATAYETVKVDQYTGRITFGTE